MRGITTSSVGKGRTVVESVESIIASPHMVKLDPIIELAIGPRPIDNFGAWWSPNRARFARLGIEFRGHDAMPIGDGAIMRPETRDGLERIADRLCAMGVRHYSMHPPDKKVLGDLDSLMYWYLDGRQIFGARNIKFALETMYHNPNRPHNLVTLEEVTWFATQAARYAAITPLVLDLAHVRINAFYAQWPNHLSKASILTAESPWMEVHVSSNNGRLDQHRSYHPQRDPDITAWLTKISQHIPRIDEGRRR